VLAPTLTIHYSTELNAIQSPLFRLPAEIRNQIYTYIFNDTLYTLNLDKWRDDRTVNFFTRCPPPFYRYLDRVLLPFACRQLHHETSLLPYQLATFDFGSAYVGCGGEVHRNQLIKAFLKARTRAQLENIGQMQVYFDMHRRQCLGFESGMMTGDGAFWAAKLGC